MMLSIILWWLQIYLDQFSDFYEDKLSYCYEISSEKNKRITEGGNSAVCFSEKFLFLARFSGPKAERAVGDCNTRNKTDMYAFAVPFGIRFSIASLPWWSYNS
ncbi:hypothetical protein GQ457_18G017430 [Hibiscus cannabinus]